MSKTMELTVNVDTLREVLVLLKSTAHHVTACRWERQLESHLKAETAAAAADEELARYRAERAAEHKLTGRQAHALAAIRADHNPWYTWSAPGQPEGRWVHGRSMGGAIARMVTGLREEGLVSPRGWSLTVAGLLRLEGWEAEHPKRRLGGWTV